MCSYRFASGRALDAFRCMALLFGILGLSACGMTGTSVTQAIPQNRPNTTTPPPSAPVVTLAATSSASMADAWKTYRNDQAGYTIDFPPTWKVDEHMDPDGADVTTFSPQPNPAGTGFTVIVQNGVSGVGGIADLPNSRCEPVMVGQLSGTRCFDTIAFSTTTIFMGRGRAYILVGSGKRLARDIYQRFLESFTIKS